MKKFLIIIFLLFLTPANAQAKSVKVVSFEEFSTDSPTSTFTLQTIEDESFDGEYILPEGTVISGHVSKVEEPKRGKRNGYFELTPTSITYNNESLDIDLSGYKVRVVGYKPISAPELAYTVAKTSAGIFVKGATQGLSFVEGVAKAQDGDRIKSGFINVYKSSPLSYLEPGQALIIREGDILVLKLIKTR